MSKLFEFIFIIFVIGVILFAIYGFINDSDTHSRIERNFNNQIEELKVDISECKKPINTASSSPKTLSN